MAPTAAGARRRRARRAARRRGRRARADAVVVERDVPRRTCALGGDELLAIYKPQRGERPLWDFPAGTLCHREVAAYEVSDALGWSIVPDTVLRDGPLGIGTMQRFVDHDPDEHYFTLLADARRRVPPHGRFRHRDQQHRPQGRPLLLGAPTARSAASTTASSFHAQWKLRTVIWDFAGEPMPAAVCVDAARLRSRSRGDVLGTACGRSRSVRARRGASAASSICSHAVRTRTPTATTTATPGRWYDVASSLDGSAYRGESLRTDSLASLASAAPIARTVARSQARDRYRVRQSLRCSLPDDVLGSVPGRRARRPRAACRPRRAPRS